LNTIAPGATAVVILIAGEVEPVSLKVTGSPALKVAELPVPRTVQFAVLVSHAFVLPSPFQRTLWEGPLWEIKTPQVLLSMVVEFATDQANPPRPEVLTVGTNVTT
jgi:hypothetical protein